MELTEEELKTVREYLEVLIEINDETSHRETKDDRSLE